MTFRRYLIKYFQGDKGMSKRTIVILDTEPAVLRVFGAFVAGLGTYVEAERTGVLHHRKQWTARRFPQAKSGPCLTTVRRDNPVPSIDINLPPNRELVNGRSVPPTCVRRTLRRLRFHD